jgi:hypothetical protein
MATVVISAHRTLKFLEGGGHFWVYLQYVQSLRQAGCEVYWLEYVRPDSRWQEPSRIETWLERLRSHGLDGNVFLYTDADRQATEYEYLVGTRSAADELFERADLLLNFHYAMDPRLLARFRRTALVDIDPGQLQMWMSSGQLSVAPHDVYFTTGETVGTPSALFPRLRAGLGSHPAAGVPGPVALHLRPRMRSIHHRHQLVGRPGGHGRQQGALRQQQAGVLPRVR